VIYYRFNGIRTSIADANRRLLLLCKKILEKSTFRR